MPGRDRTGPQGAGALTGRGAGDCAGVASKDDASRGFGRVRGGGGRGWGGRGRGDWSFRGGRGGGRGQGGRGGGNKPGSGPEGQCVCPECGHKVAHKAGQRCMDVACPKCGAQMIRE